MRKVIEAISDFTGARMERFLSVGISLVVVMCSGYAQNHSQCYLSSTGQLNWGTNPSDSELMSEMQLQAQANNIPYEIIAAVCYQESGYKQFASDGYLLHNVTECKGLYNGNTSPNPPGLGMMQLTGGTAVGYNIEYLRTDWKYNLWAGVSVLLDKLGIYKYNAGSALSATIEANRSVIENWYFPLWYYNGYVANYGSYADTIFSIIQNKPGNVATFIAANITLSYPYNVIPHFFSSGWQPYGDGKGDPFAATANGTWKCYHGNTYSYPVTISSGGGSPPPAPDGLGAGGVINGNSVDVTFWWNASGGADGYWLDIAQSSNDLESMTGTFQNFNTGATSSTISLLHSTSYYWRVYAYNSFGGNHGYPPSPYTTPAIGGGPASGPDFLWPVSGTVTQHFDGTFSGMDAGWYWDSNHNHKYFQGLSVTGYRMHRAIDISATSGTPVKTARAGTAYTYPNNNFYGNRVVVDHGSGYYTLYAHLSSIEVSYGAAVDTNTVIGKVGMTGTATGPHLHFEIRKSPSAYYYAPEAYFIPDDGYASVGTAVEFDYPDIGNLGGSAPAAPEGLAASGVISGSMVDVTFSWNGSGGAEGYWLDIAQSQYDLENMTGTFWNFNTSATSSTFSLLPSASYFWRVYAYNSFGGNHGYPAQQPFTTPVLPTPPATPTGLYASATVSGTSAIVTFSWNASSGADGYWLDIAQSEYDLYYMTGTFQNFYTGTATSSTLSLLPSTAYYWRVYAFNSAGGSHGYPVTQPFWTPSAAPGTPTGLLASGMATGGTIYQQQVNLTWNAVPGATSYEVYIHFYDWATSQWTYYYTYYPSTNGMTFWPQLTQHWFSYTVRAVNSAGAGDWSAWCDFYMNY